jgi:hypothetical protein
MNTRRILGAGLVAGLVLATLDGIVNAVVLGSRWDAAYAQLGLPTKNVGVPIFWTSFDIFAGVVIAWLYAAMRPRFGPGPRTAAYAALVEWLLLHLTLASHLVDGVFPPSLIGPITGAELATALVAGMVAGKLYREEAPAAASRAAA